MVITCDQRRDLEKAARCGKPLYVRRKALALANLAEGRSVREVSRVLRVLRPSVYLWQSRYLKEGLSGLTVRPGRGRRPKADLGELELYVRQSPRKYGVARTRWSLATLAQVVPSLKGFTPRGVQKALARAGFHYKRGQPGLHSPDPQYAVKKGLWTRR
jgi:transposase